MGKGLGRGRTGVAGKWHNTRLSSSTQVVSNPVGDATSVELATDDVLQRAILQTLFSTRALGHVDTRNDDVSPDGQRFLMIVLLGDYPSVRYYLPSGDLCFDILTRLGEVARFDDVAAEIKNVEGSEDGFDRFLRHCARYRRLAPRRYPRGIFKFRTLEEARLARRSHRAGVNLPST